MYAMNLILAGNFKLLFFVEKKIPRFRYIYKIRVFAIKPNSFSWTEILQLSELR